MRLHGRCKPNIYAGRRESALAEERSWLLALGFQLKAKVKSLKANFSHAVTVAWRARHGPAGTLAFKNSNCHCGRTVKTWTAAGITTASPLPVSPGRGPAPRQLRSLPPRPGFARKFLLNCRSWRTPAALLIQTGPREIGCGNHGRAPVLAATHSNRRGANHFAGVIMLFDRSEARSRCSGRGRP